MSVSRPELIRAFARIGLLSFGGPAAQIALMHSELVEKRGWVTEKDYLSALSFCMLLPGPEAMQLATWVGWRLHGTVGGLIAGLLFVLPGAVVVLALSIVYAAFGQIPLVAALFSGVQAAVLAIVVEALLRVAKRALKTRAHWVVAALGFAALFAFAVPFPVVILAAGLWGFFTAPAFTPPAFTPPAFAPPAFTPPTSGSPLPAATRPKTLQTVAIWGAIWLIPLGALWLFNTGLLFEIGWFFSKLATLTFGGAYAVLVWMAQEVVADKGWLTAAQMMDGLGLAETTPGPLILVTVFVAYVAAHQVGGIALGIAAAGITLWMTFAPCFLWIFAGAPYIARLMAQPRLAGAFAAIMAAVVGVIANLSLWFGIHVLFTRVGPFQAGPLRLTIPDPASLDPLTAILALAAAFLILRRHWALVPVLVLAAGASGLATLLWA